MKQKKIIYSFLSLLFLIALVFGFIIFYQKKSTARVIFLDVGQGDAILISRGNNQILIDGGRDEKLILEKLGRYIPFWDRQIELVVATHPDQDHIGGLVGVLETYQIGVIMASNSKNDTQVFAKLEELVEQNKIRKIMGGVGDKIEIGDNFAASVLSAEQGSEKDQNIASLVMQLKFFDFDFLLTGDLPKEGEEKLIDSGKSLQSEVLKVAHHGSRSSTTEEFLAAVQPKTAIISVGKNSYGHPNDEVMKKLEKAGVRILRTDEKGDVEYDCSWSDQICHLAI